MNSGDVSMNSSVDKIEKLSSKMLPGIESKVMKVIKEVKLETFLVGQNGGIHGQCDQIKIISLKFGHFPTAIIICQTT